MSEQNAAPVSTTKPAQQENGFLNILFNVLLPVFILNKGSKLMGPLPALILAVSLPLAYGLYDLRKRRKINPLSILGLLNVMVTGGLALSRLNGIWFAVKEAAFPALVGIFVFASAFTRRPFIETLLMNPSVMDTDLIQKKLEERGHVQDFHDHMRKATMGLTLSFLFSAVLNFVLARYIFLDIDPTLDQVATDIVLNEQIAKMTTWSMVVIMVPSMAFLLAIFWYLLKGIQKFSGLTTDQIIIQK